MIDSDYNADSVGDNGVVVDNGDERASNLKMVTRHHWCFCSQSLKEDLSSGESQNTSMLVGTPPRPVVIDCQ